MSYRDFEEFLESFNETGARYLVVGAHAVAFHARPRATKDLDLFIDPAPDNVERVLAGIRRFFGGSDLGISVDDLTDPDAAGSASRKPGRTVSRGGSGRSRHSSSPSTI